MRAVSMERYGGPEVLHYGEQPDPPLGAGQVLVAVRAAGVNPIDWRLRSGAMQQFVPCQFPAILGREVAGVVVRTGKDVTGWRVGDAVYGFLQQPVVKWGAYAERVPADAHKLAHKPQALSFEQAAAVPVALHTAQQGLFERAGLKAGETVLVHGGAGGVGMMAIQLARIAGAKVIATASPENHDFVRSLGAQMVVDYHAADFALQIQREFPDGVAVIFAPFAGQSLQGSAPLVNANTRIIILSPVAGPADRQIGPVRSELLVASADGPALEAAAPLLQSGQLRVELAAVLPLSAAARAHEMSEAGHVRGKLVLVPERGAEPA